MLLLSYIEGTRLKIRPNQDALKGMLNLSNATVKLEQWCLRLSRMEFEGVHRTGIKHQAADAWSQIPAAAESCNSIDDAIPVMLISPLPMRWKKMTHQTQERLRRLCQQWCYRRLPQIICCMPNQGIKGRDYHNNNNGACNQAGQDYPLLSSGGHYRETQLMFPVRPSLYLGS